MLFDLSGEKEIKNQIEYLFDYQEIAWALKARQLWLINGDGNTKYFYAAVNRKISKMRIEQIKDDNVIWQSDQTAIKQIAQNFFKRIYTFDDDELNKMRSCSIWDE